jgi:hypothetical protein
MDDDGRVHVELARALAPVLQDLTTTGGPVPRVLDDDWTGDPDFAGATLLNDARNHGAGVSVQLGLPCVEQVLRAADMVQEWAVEELWGSAPTNWPPCPHHPTTHPLQVELRDGAAWWSCPKDGTGFAVVGTLR